MITPNFQMTHFAILVKKKHKTQPHGRMPKTKCFFWPMTETHAAVIKGSPPTTCSCVKCVRPQGRSAQASVRMWLWGACGWCSGHASSGVHKRAWAVDACSHHAEQANRKIAPPVCCWFWVVPRSMLLEALTCWNCRWLWVGDCGCAGLEMWEVSLKWVEDKKPLQHNNAVKALTKRALSSFLGAM